MFVTFYSYKGGVGRSLALANVACLLGEDEEHPQRVLVWDLDLEAPGLHQLFPPKRPQRYGFVDLAHEFGTSGAMPAVSDYIYESEVTGVHVLPAGRVDDSYCRKLQEIDWLGFFGADPKDPGPFFSSVANSIRGGELPYDYVLIDSRTGLSDLAGIGTQILSDLLVVLFRLTDQNLDGLEHLAPAIRAQLDSRGKKDVAVLPVASQVGSAASRGVSKQRERAQAIFGGKFEYIRFDEALVSVEELFCLRKRMRSMWPRPPIVDDYTRLCSIIRKRNTGDTQTQARALGERMIERDTASAWPIAMRLLRRRPRLRFAWQALSEMLVQETTTSSQREQAQQSVKKVLEDDPTNSLAHFWQARFDLQDATEPGSPAVLQAQKSLMIALEHAEANEQPRTLGLLASVASCLGDLDTAARRLGEARELMPENVQLALELAALHIRMGAAYFGTAAQELDDVPEDAGEEKYIPLAYLRAFLDEPDKAEEALKSCSDMVALARAHVCLIRRKKQEAMQMAEKEIQSPGKAGPDRDNWIEFLICAEEFKKAIDLAEATADARSSSPRNTHGLIALATYLQNKGDKRTPNDVLDTWRRATWNFRELLLFRECCARDSKNYVSRLAIVERLLRGQDLENMRSRFSVRIWPRRSTRLRALRRGPRRGARADKT